MIKRRRKKLFLITSLLALGGLILCVIFLPPTFTLKLSYMNIPLVVLVFFLLFLFLYSLTAYLFRSFIHGILVGLFPVMYLIMRLNELTSPLFFVLLAGLFVALEILLVQMVKKNTV